MEFDNPSRFINEIDPALIDDQAKGLLSSEVMRMKTIDWIIQTTTVTTTRMFQVGLLPIIVKYRRRYLNTEMHIIRTSNL